jgi:hypothetical protein
MAPVAVPVATTVAAASMKAPKAAKQAEAPSISSCRGFRLDAPVAKVQGLRLAFQWIGTNATAENRRLSRNLLCVRSDRCHETFKELDWIENHLMMTTKMLLLEFTI